MVEHDGMLPQLEPFDAVWPTNLHVEIASERPVGPCNRCFFDCTQCWPISLRGCYPLKYNLVGGVIISQKSRTIAAGHPQRIAQILVLPHVKRLSPTSLRGSGLRFSPNLFLNWSCEVLQQPLLAEMSKFMRLMVTGTSCETISLVVAILAGEEE
ncbi:hypothetical protein BDN72DRAFT_57508 [Pluteus cervinus]|uniref:Uncharacterized protein n=1 Tax=Pluteus cervinus TaxID=181527 RepID=A0ACD3B9H5_9AGAR|nr:hypothetical protein BDN72DRAFT_57508 [Pluteus cervinus]